LGFFTDIILPAALVDSVSNRNEYQEYFVGGKSGRFLGLTTLSPSCADCHEIWKPQPPGTFWVCNIPVQGLILLWFRRNYMSCVTQWKVSFLSVTNRSFLLDLFNEKVFANPFLKLRVFVLYLIFRKIMCILSTNYLFVR